MPGPRVEPYVCIGCGAVSDKDGEPLPHECEGDEHEPRRVPVLPDRVSHIDPVEKIPGTDDPMPNVYAQRTKIRLRADASYLQLQTIHGHAVAADIVCEEFGHDARAGWCDRCGRRVEQTLED